MAETAFLAMTANDADVAGEPTKIGRDGTIECLNVDFGVDSAVDRATGKPTGLAEFAPIKFRKRVDLATPAIAKALTSRQICTGAFTFYRPTAKSDSTKFLTLEIQNAFVKSVDIVLPDLTAGPRQDLETYEEVTMSYSYIKWSYSNANGETTEHEYEWSTPES